MARCFDFLQWEYAMIQRIFLMILRVNRMIHVFRLHRKGREIAEFSPDTRLRMAGALNKQGRLLYFYGLGGGSGDGARGFVGHQHQDMWYPARRKAPFPSWVETHSNGNSNEALRWPPITTTTTSTNSRWGEMSNSRHGASKEHGQHRQHHVLSMVFIILKGSLISINMFFNVFQPAFFTKITLISSSFCKVTLLSQYQEDFSSYTLKQFMDDYTKAATVQGIFMFCFREKDDLGSRGKKLYEWNFCL